MVNRLRFGAAAPAGQAQQRRHPAPAGDALVRASGQLDRLIRDVQLGVRSAASYDELEEQAQAIAAAIVAAFRKPVVRPVHPPVWQSADGAQLRGDAMIDVPALKRDVAQLPGECVAMPRRVFDEIAVDLERGQACAMRLINIGSAATTAASALLRGGA